MVEPTRRWFGIGSAALAAMVYGRRADGEPMPATIVVDRQTLPIDSPVAIELRGFPPGRPVTLTATETFPSGSRWQARATFVADESGRIDVAHQAPVSGSYDGVSPMGLFWSMARLPGEALPIPADSMTRAFRARLEATSAEGVEAATELERRVAAPGVTRQPIRTAGLVGTLFLPPGEGRFPAVIVVGGGGGAIEEFKAAVLASHGYAALALAYFAQPGLPRGLVNIPLEYFEGAIAWVRAQPWFSDRLLAVWGDSRGGELALLLGATFPEIGAVMAWAPSPATPGLVRHGHFAAIRCRFFRRTTRPAIRCRPSNWAVRWPTRRSTEASCAMPRRSSVRPFRSRRSAAQSSSSPAWTTRCGRHPIWPISHSAGWKRTVIRLPSVT